MKIFNRCNLSCDYCYVYELQDQSWRSRPAGMAMSTLQATAARIAEHVKDHVLDTVRVVFHGGEPLLAGAEFLGEAARVLRAQIPRTTRVDLALQTNGVLLTDVMLRVLVAHEIKVGISVDGGQAAQDRHRRSATGRSSWPAVSAALRRLRQPRFRDVYGGLLCTIDLDNDPVETYEALLELDPPRLNFLLPHGNWTHPPPGRDLTTPSAVPYAQWLIAVFDRWYGQERRETSIRLFEEIMSLCLGGSSRSEAVGLSPASLIVVDTDGSFQPCDALRSAYDGATATGLDVFAHPVDAALTHPTLIAQQIGADALCDTCHRCPERTVCGGGLFAHRYRAGKGFLNPSVYCSDLQQLIQHIRPRTIRDAKALLGLP